MSSAVFKSEEGKQKIHELYRGLLVQWPIPKTERFVDTCLGHTFVIECGDASKPPLILLHGSVSNSFTWMGDVARFSQQHHVFAVDLVGEPGYSAESRPTYESGDYARWLLDVITALNLDRVSMVGLSLGGWMALDFATTYPDKVRKIALICPGGLGRQRLSLLPKAIFYSLFGQWGRDRMTRMLNGGPLPKSEKLQQAMNITMAFNQHFRPRTGFLLIFSAERLAKLTMPVLVYFGDRDAVLDGAASLQHARDHIPQCRAVELKHTGHLIMDRGGEIAEFLQQA